MSGTIIKNGNFAKALWPGVKAFMEKVYTNEEYLTNYIQQAEASDDLLDTMAYSTNTLGNPSTAATYCEGDWVCYDKNVDNVWYGRVKRAFAGGAAVEGVIVNRRTKVVTKIDPVWTCQFPDLRFMSQDEIQHYGDQCLGVENFDTGFGDLLGPAPAVEDRIGLRREEIDWDAHKAFMRDL